MRLALISVSVIGIVAAGGCATRDYVQEHVASINEKIAKTQARADDQKRRLSDHDARLADLDRTSREALDRAKDAGELAMGKFVYEMVLRDGSVKFSSANSALSASAKSRLIALVNKLKLENKNFYLEIQGHTDSTGGEDYNLRLGEERAKVVRLFLNQRGVALNRLGVISYGSTVPVASNTTREGRAQNRRVLIIVLD
jgi:peptidoglycan-associated lipoprotein